MCNGRTRVPDLRCMISIQLQQLQFSFKVGRHPGARCTSGLSDFNNFTAIYFVYNANNSINTKFQFNYLQMLNDFGGRSL